MAENKNCLGINWASTFFRKTFGLSQNFSQPSKLGLVDKIYSWINSFLQVGQSCFRVGSLLYWLLLVLLVVHLGHGIGSIRIMELLAILVRLSCILVLDTILRIVISIHIRKFLIIQIKWD